MNYKIICTLILLTGLYIVTAAFQQGRSISGTFKFVGGIYNGKAEGSPVQYSMQKVFSTGHYDAFVLEQGYKPAKYETGTYSIKGDTCTDTETWCGQPSKITNIPIHYLYTFKNDTITFKGTLPSGMKVTEYWKKIK